MENGMHDDTSPTDALESRLIQGALISSDEALRGMVMDAMQDEAFPIHVGLELEMDPGTMDPETMEHLHASGPDLVVLDMSADPDETIRVARTIASSNPRIVLVGIGPELDAGQLLESMRAGVVEYVPRPVDRATLWEALERVVRRQGRGSLERRRAGKLYAFFSPKGGAGLTTVVTNVAIELHRMTGRKTLLVDLDLELGDIASLLSVRPRFHFIDLLRNFHRMDADLLTSYIERHESGVHVLSAPFEPEVGGEVTGDEISVALGFLRQQYDYVLVDTSKSLAPSALAALQLADLIFLVTNMDVPSLRNFKRCLPILDRITAGDPDRVRLIVNRLNPKGLISLADLEETVGIPVYWTLTNDFETVIESISVGRPLVLDGSSHYATQLGELAGDIADGAAGEGPDSLSLLERVLTPFRSAFTKEPLGSPAAKASSHA